MTDTTQNLAAASLTFSVLSFLVLSVSLILFLFPDFASTLRSGVSRMGTTNPSGFKVVGAFAGAFSPDITLLSGFVSDIMNGSFRYSVTSMIGVGAVLLHWLIAGMYYGFSKGGVPDAPVEQAVAAVTAAANTGPIAAVSQLLGVGAEPRPRSNTMSTISTIRGAPSVRPTRAAAAASTDATARLVASGQVGGAIPAYIQANFNPCSIRGLGMFDISQSPMGIAALSSVFAVYLLDMFVDDKRSKKDIGVYLLFSAGVYGLNLFAYKEFQCYGDTYGSVAKATVLPLIVGLAAGSAGFSVLKSTFPSYLPLDANNIGSPAQPGKFAQCSPPNDQDQFVCDAYKDGKRISTSVVGN